MSGVCGWIGGLSEQTSDGPDILQAMRDRLSGNPSMPKPATVCSPPVTAIGGLTEVDLLRTDDLTIALDGRYRWIDPALQATAEKVGPAHAAAQAYRQHGTDCLRLMRGSFAIAILEGHARAMLAIDRMGIRTMCYALAPGSLVFGSTAESVAAHPAIGRAVSAQAIFNYLYCHVVPSPGTIFAGVNKIQPGECVLFSNGQITRRFYWHLDYHDSSRFDFAESAKRLRHLLADAVTRACGEDSQVGAFLSGGVDSSTVTGMMSKLFPAPTKTYSIGFSASGFDEMHFAAIAARHFGTEAHTYYVTPADIMTAIPIIAEVYDEPFGNESAVPTYFGAKMAAEDGTRVILGGDGGDEIFGGNARYAKQKLFEVYWHMPAPIRHRLLEPFAKTIPEQSGLGPARKLKSYVEQASMPLPDRLESYNFLHRSPLSDTLNADFLSAIDPAEPLILLRDVFARTRSRFAVNRMMHVDLKLTLADNDLRKVSRMCETAGVEIRFPMLDDGLVEFSGEIPASMKVRGLRLRHFFKQAMSDFLPPETIRKTKHGFGLPFGLWLKEYKPLSELVYASLDDFKKRHILRVGYLDELVRQHANAHATYFGTMIWIVTILERWLASRRL